MLIKNAIIITNFKITFYVFLCLSIGCVRKGVGKQ